MSDAQKIIDLLQDIKLAMLLLNIICAFGVAAFAFSQIGKK